MNNNNASLQCLSSQKSIVVLFLYEQFIFTAQDDNSASCEQETDGLHKALEVSILRNEVC